MKVASPHQRYLPPPPPPLQEGFVGAAVFTVVWALLLATLLSPYPYLTCPPSGATWASGAAFGGGGTCTPSHVFTATNVGSVADLLAHVGLKF